MIIESSLIVNNPVVSVVVLTYNQERYIAQTIDAVLAQKTDFPFELIIADDCSKDRTQEICREYQQRYPTKVRLLLQDVNKGVIYNFRDVNNLSRGKYVASMGGDDFWIMDTKLQIQKEYLDSHPHCGLCFTNMNTCNEQGEIIRERYLKTDELSKSFEEHLLSKGYIAPLTWMYKREMVDRYDINGAFTDESFGFALDIFAVSEVDYIDVVSAMYRVADGSLSHPTSNAKWYKQYLGVFRAQLYYCDKYKVTQDVRNKVLLNGYIELLPYAYTCNDSAFIEEALSQSMEIGVDLMPYLEICEQKNDAEKSLQHIRNSHAYKIGRALLKPLKCFKKR